MRDLVIHVGGKSVCKEWLENRGETDAKPGRVLTDADILHYHRVITALRETIRLMAEIDQVLNQRGGWPEIFASRCEDSTHDGRELPLA